VRRHALARDAFKYIRLLAHTLSRGTTTSFVTARPSHMRVADHLLVLSASSVVASSKPEAIVPRIAEGIQTSAA
jgi:hypothetical protein